MNALKAVVLPGSLHLLKVAGFFVISDAAVMIVVKS
jgi:hypothetical protein